MENEKELTWISVLNWLCSELFGEEVFLIYQGHQFTGHPIADNEMPYDNVELSAFEKRFYDLIDAAILYLKDNDYRLPRGEGDEKRAITQGLKEIFWAIIKLNHPEFFRSPGGIGIRDGYRIVALPAPQGGSFIEIPFPFGPKGRRP
jgi:hypothetical protein